MDDLIVFVIRQRAAKPAFGDKELAAFLGGVLDACCACFWCDEHHLAALANVWDKKSHAASSCTTVLLRSMM